MSLYCLQTKCKMNNLKRLRYKYNYFFNNFAKKYKNINAPIKNKYQ